MTLIEQAAKRLERLERAGVKPPQPPGPAVAEIPAIPPPPLQRSDDHRLQSQDFELVDKAEKPSLPATPPKLLADELAGPRSRVFDLDLARLVEAGIVTPDAPRSRAADEFRVIKRPLLENARNAGIKHGNLIFITSALPGEGKSFTSVNLAMSLAKELDVTVLLVDADVARPSLPRMLGLPPAKGLLDLLLDASLQVADVLLRTNVKNLTVLPAGTKHGRATELLASAAMNRLLEEMAQRYSDRIIIFDSPPLLVTTESRVLATHMGQVVLVVLVDSTPQSVVKHALATIEACPVKLLLLSKARGGSHGGYGYGYGYGHGYGDDSGSENDRG